MIRYAILIALLSAAPLFGQTKEVVEEVNALLDQQRIALRHAEERNEDIEVLRRLLNKAFGFDHKTSQLAEGMQPHLWGSTAIPPGGGGLTGGSFPGGYGSSYTIPPVVGKRVSQAVGPFDGVYLKGAGVVFTLRIPREDAFATASPLCVGSPAGELGLNTSCSKCHQDVKTAHGAKAAANCNSCHTAVVSLNPVQPLSDWDRIRADVRGEKVPEVKAPIADPKKPRAAMCKPGDIRELLAAELFAHAKNVRNLDKNDWVTVVVTFDELPGAKAAVLPPTAKPGFTPDELQTITLADLHMKQGKFAEAAAAYEKGLARYRDEVVKLTFPPNISAAAVQKAVEETEKSARGLFKSLATAYLQLNDLDKAKAALVKATSLKMELATAGTEKAKPQVPAKIHLAVAKSDIDRVKTLDEFRKSLHLELIGFPDAPAKK